MKKILLFLIILISIQAIGQNPRPATTQLPQKLEYKWYEVTNFMSIDSGLTISRRDTNFISRFPGTLVRQPSDGIMYMSADNITAYGKHWDAVGSGSGSESTTVSSVGGGLDIQAGEVGDDIQIRTLSGTDFNISANLISIDYPNGQAATSSQDGFLQSTDWTTFNNKFTYSLEVLEDDLYPNIVDDKSIDFTYNDIGNQLSAQLVNDEASPSNGKFYGKISGVKGWFSIGTSTGYGIINTGDAWNPALEADTSSSNGLATQFDISGFGGLSRFGLEDALATTSRTFDADSNFFTFDKTKRFLVDYGTYSSSSEDYHRLDMNNTTAGSPYFQMQVGNTTNKNAYIYGEAGYGVDVRTVGGGIYLFSTISGNTANIVIDPSDVMSFYHPTGNYEMWNIPNSSSSTDSVLVITALEQIRKISKSDLLGGGGGGTGSNLSWNGGTHAVDIDGGGTSATIPLATSATDGLLSTANQSVKGIKTFDDAIQASSYVEWKSGTGAVMGVLANRSSGADDYGSVQFYNDLNANIVHFSILNPTATRNINLPDASGTVVLTSDLSSFITSETDPLSIHLTGTSTLTGNATIALDNKQLNIQDLSNSGATGIKNRVRGTTTEVSTDVINGQFIASAADYPNFDYEQKLQVVGGSTGYIDLFAASVNTSEGNELYLNKDSIVLKTRSTTARTILKLDKLPFKSSLLSTDSLLLTDVDGKTWKINKNDIGAGGSYTDEQAQDAVGTILNTNTFNYDDATPAITLKTQMSLTSDASGVKLNGDVSSPGNKYYYGTNASGTKGFYTLASASPGIDDVLSVGQSLTTNRSINTTTFNLTVAGSVNGTPFSVWQNSASSFQPALLVNAASGKGVQVSLGTASTDYPFYAQNAKANSGSVVKGLLLHNIDTGTPTDGNGVSIDFMATTSGTGFGDRISNTIEGYWFENNNNTRTSYYNFKGYNSATSEVFMQVQPDWVIINNGADSVSSMAYARSLASGGGYTDEAAQDAVGAMVNSTLTYVDATPLLGINLGNANTWTADQSVPAEAYDATAWNGSNEVPTKNDIRDKIETIVSFTYSRNMITATSVGTDANITAAAGTAYNLPAATLSADRTIDVSGLNTNGDYIELYNNETGFIWSFTGATVYDSDGSTTITELLANANSVIRRINGKLMISKL